MVEWFQRNREACFNGMICLSRTMQTSFTPLCSTRTQRLTDNRNLQQQPQQHTRELGVALAAVLGQVLPRHQAQLARQVLEGEALMRHRARVR